MNENFKIAQTVNRKRAVEAGFYDGRFSERVVQDQKKSNYRKLRKSKNTLWNALNDME